MILRGKKKGRALVSIAGIFLLTVSMASPVSASGESSLMSKKLEVAEPDVRVGLEPCVDLAKSLGDKQWICTAERLAVNEDSRGKKIEAFVALKSTDYKSTSSAKASDFTVMKGGDSYDTWCETGTICHRLISDYISETKGNAAYGDAKGAVGSYDVIIKTELNGRQANTTITTIWDSGPSLAFSSTRTQCLQHSAIPKICQNHSYPNATISTTSYKKKYGKVWGHLLVNAGKYNYKFLTSFTPAGRPKYTAASLSTALLTCPKGKGGCYYP